MPAEAYRARQSSGAFDGDAEALGGEGGVGIGGVLCGPESGDAKRPRRATPEALGLRRESPLSIRRGAPCVRKLVERISPLGFWMGTRSLWEAEAGMGLAAFCAARERRFSPQSNGGGQAAAKMPRRARRRLFDGDAESLGGRGGVGIGGVLCGPESGDSRRSPMAADKPPLRCPVKHAGGFWMGTRSLWEAEVGLGLAECLCGPESGDAKRPRRATPEALGLRRVSPLSIRRGAPCLRKLYRGRQSSGALTGDAESLGGRGGVGIGGVSVWARKRRFSPQSKGGGQAAAKMPRQARRRLLTGDGESLGGRGGVGIGGVSVWARKGRC